MEMTPRHYHTLPGRKPVKQFHFRAQNTTEYKYKNIAKLGKVEIKVHNVQIYQIS
jgi:hypothetical protein